jgi:hypothetical protein
MNTKVLYNTIFSRIEKEDLDLTTLNGEGIFFAPELFIAFTIGKEIKRNEVSVFGERTQWHREIDFGNGGPTDFAFRTSEKIYAFELKIRDTYHSYCSDIEKLNKLDDNYEKFFIALVDSWESKKEKDNRILNVENKYPNLLRSVNDFKSFPTQQKRYDGNVCCTLAIWKL